MYTMTKLCLPPPNKSKYCNLHMFSHILPILLMSHLMQTTNNVCKELLAREKYTGVLLNAFIRQWVHKFNIRKYNNCDFICM